MSTHPNPHSRLTDAMRLVLRNIHRAGRPPMYLLTAQQARLFYEVSASILDLPEPQIARVEDLHIPMRDGHLIKARLFAPTAKSDGMAAASPLAVFKRTTYFAESCRALRTVL